jgi:anti-anti-sigma factor
MQLSDLQGIEDKFKALIDGHQAVIVDLSGLDGLFSMGLRALIMCAQLLDLKRGKLALMTPSDNVLAVLHASGVSQLIPICRDQEEAEAVVVLSTIT